MVLFFRRILTRWRGRYELMCVRMQLRQMTGVEQLGRYIGLGTMAFMFFFCAIRMSVYAQDRVVGSLQKRLKKNKTRAEKNGPIQEE